MRGAPRSRPDAATGLALAAIRFYQRHLSPRKGFRCALRAATGGASCSAYGHQVIARYGLRLGLGLLDRRLALCGHIHRRQRIPLHPRVRAQQGHCDVPCDAPHLTCELPCHAPHLHCGLPCDGHAAGDCVADSLQFCDCQCGGERRPYGEDRRQLDAVAERIRRRRADLRQDDGGSPA